MAYKLAVKIATKSACYNDPRKMQGPLGAMLHSVGCSQPSAEKSMTGCNQQARMTHTTPEIASDSKARSMKA